MNYILEGLKNAFIMIFTLDKEFVAVIGVSIRVSFIATVLATILAIPVGLWVGLGKFKGRDCITVILNTLMSIPTVVVGLLVYSFISRQGPLGRLGILFTPTAMVIGQVILAFPIIAGISIGAVRNLGDAPFVAASLLGASKIRAGMLFLGEARIAILSSIIAGFGRVFSEVGISMMLGGNIRFYTRNITTTIALETSKGNFALAIAGGLILLVIALVINISIYYFSRHKSVNSPTDAPFIVAKD